MSIESVITAEMVKVAAQYERRLTPLLPETKLVDTGLDSLCFAVLVVRLEECLGVDPFSSATDTGFPATFGEFVRAYENGSR
jgi:acyl carrier protein